MSERVKGNPALEPRRVVAQPGRDPGMREFMRSGKNPQKENVD